MKAFLTLCVVVAGLHFTGIAQSGKIVGIVFEQEQGGERKPIAAGASVFVPGVASTTTDYRGYYSIDLSQCRACTPGAAVRVCVKAKTGYSESEFVIPLGSGLHPFNIIINHTSRLVLVGVVRSRRTGKFLKGIRVSVLLQHYEGTIPVAFTDEKGAFQLVLSRDGIANVQAIKLSLSDDKKKYKDRTETVFINPIDPITVDMDEVEAGGLRTSVSTSLAVGRPILSKIYVQRGDVVQIHAEGVMRLGQRVGNSGPGGISAGVLGFSLIGYNIFPNWNHGVLVYRFGEEDAWKYYDYNSKNEYAAHSAGFIEFNINDRQQGDNAGAYEVTVTIKR